MPELIFSQVVEKLAPALFIVKKYYMKEVNAYCKQQYDIPGFAGYVWSILCDAVRDIYEG